MEVAQSCISSREFVDWMAYDELEPIGPRVTPDLLALLISMTANMYKAKGTRPTLPQDIFPDPLLPQRLSAAEEASRVASIGQGYRKARAERLKQEH